MKDDLPTVFRQTFTRRTTSLSDGQKLCGIILAICAAPLFKVDGWMAVWLLSLITIVGLGTFGLWFFRAVTGKTEPTEEHTENMAAISLLGKNKDGKEPEVIQVEQQVLTSNPKSDANPGASDEIE
ncbi:MAG: hypothetical protein AAF250_01895 [Pseudomonadota bacterium]